MDTPEVPSPNLIVNGSVEGSVAPWALQVKSPAAGTVGVDSTTRASGSSSAIITTTAATPSSAYNLQLKQDNISLTAANQHSLSFAAKADAGKTIGVMFQQRLSPYTVYYQQKTVPLTTASHAFTYAFTPTTGDSGAVLLFNLFKRAEISGWIMSPSPAPLVSRSLPLPNR